MVPNLASVKHRNCFGCNSATDYECGGAVSLPTALGLVHSSNLSEASFRIATGGDVRTARGRMNAHRSFSDDCIRFKMEKQPNTRCAGPVTQRP